MGFLFLTSADFMFVFEFITVFLLWDSEFEQNMDF